MAQSKPLPTLEQQGLPVNIDAERMVLGQLIIDGSQFEEVQSKITGEAFAIEKHRTIWAAMERMHGKKRAIDRMTLLNHLITRGELEKVDGITYIISLDADMPLIPNMGSYVSIVHEKFMLRQIITTARRMEQEALAGVADYTKILSAAELDVATLSNAVVDENSASVKSAAQIMDEYDGGRLAFLQPHLGPRGLTTGMPRLDRLIGGLDKDDLLILAGQPSDGKSALLTGMMSHIARTHGPAMIFSLEMSNDLNVRRQICALAGVSFTKFKRGQLDQVQRKSVMDAAGTLHGAQMYFDDTSGITLHDLYQRARFAVKKLGVIAVGVDYLQIMNLYNSGNGLRFQTEREGLSYICNTIKAAFKKLGVPLILLSQFSRAQTKRGKDDARPKLSDLEGSGAIEKAGTKALFIYRPERHEPNNPEHKGKAELIVRKNRNGPLGTIETKFLKTSMSFVEAIPTEATYEDDE